MTNKKLPLLIVLTLTLCSGMAVGKPLDTIQTDRDGMVKYVPLWMIKASNFPTKTGKVIEWNMASLRAYTVAYESLQKTTAIPTERKKIENYRAVYISEDASNYYLYFDGKEKINRAPPGYTITDNGTHLAQSANYTISKTDFKVVSARFPIL